MIFAGLPLATLAAIFAAAASCIVFFYILKLRRRVVAVPFSPLWQRILRDKDATSLFSRLKRLLSLLLQLALLALLVLALGDPRAAATLFKGRTLVVLLDASASMQATDVSPNRLAEARDHARKMIRGLGGSDRMLIAQMDAMVTPLGPMTGDTGELERALDRVRVTDSRADFPRALRFATDTLRGADNAEIVVVSDGELGTPGDAAGPVRLGDAKLSYVGVGTGARNEAITQFSVRRYPLDKSRYEVMLEVSNTGPEQEDVELSLLGDGKLVDVTKLRLKPGERLPRFYPNLSGASRSLEAKIAPLEASKDELPADNHAYALLPERRRAKVLVVTEGNMYLEAALLLDEYLDVTQIAPTQYAAQFAGSVAAGAGGGAKRTWDVIVFDRATPAELPNVPALYLDPRGPGSPVKVDGELDQPGFDKIDRKHPLARFAALDDVNIAKGHKLVADASQGDKVVGASEGSPILVAGARRGVKFAALGFDVRDSDFALRVAWPLFLLNTINWFTGEDENYLSSFRTGEVWRIPVGGNVAQVELTGPGGLKQLLPVHEGRAVYLGQQAGFFELTLPEAGGPDNARDAKDAPDANGAGGSVGAGGARTTLSFAANLLDQSESTIAPVKTLNVDGKGAGDVAGFTIGVRREIWIYLLLAALLLTSLEWATYHRRLTV